METNDKYGYNISIVDHDNEKWVRVQCAGEDFIIAPHDLKDGNGDIMVDCKQPDLMARLEELHLDTFNKAQGLAIAMCIEEINAALIKAGGDEFAEDWYASKELWWPVGSSDDYYGGYTWYFYGGNGCFYDHYRYSGIFRSRPVLAYDGQTHSGHIHDQTDVYYHEGLLMRGGLE